MNAYAESIQWNRLVAPPRSVPASVRARVRLTEIKKAINLRSGFLGLWSLAAGIMLVIFGTVWFYGANEDDYPIAGAYLAAGGVAVVIVLIVVISRRGTRIIRLMQNGTLCRGMVTHVREAGLYGPYTSFVAKWQEFLAQCRAAGADWESSQGNNHSRPRIPPAVGGNYHDWALSQTMSHSRHLPCKVRVTDQSGATHDIHVRLDLAFLLGLDSAEPQVEVLCDPNRGNYGVATSQFDSELTISPEGQWGVKRSSSFLALAALVLRSAVPVVGTYVAAALGLTWFDGAMPTEAMVNVGPLAGAAVVLLFTLSHVLFPVLFFRSYLDFISKFIRSAKGAQAGPVRVLLLFLRGWAGLFMGVWFAVPIAMLAWLTGWLTLVWAAVHLALARRGSRTWVFVEYGSTSMALLLLVACFSAERLFPLGILVVLLQALLLAVLDLKARERWVAPETELA